MARTNNIWLIAAILLFCTTSLNAVDVSGITIALPNDCSVKLRWVSPPLDSKTIREAKWYHTYNWHENFCFSVDATGQPWFAVPDQYNRKGIVFNPIRQYRFGLSHPFRGMVCLDNGALLFHTDHDLGFISSPETLPVEDGIALVPFQPAITLPLPDSRIYSGANNALYIVGTASNGDNEVYLLQPEAVSQGNQKIVRHFRRLFASQESIGSVTGDGRTTFIAVDHTIVQISHDGRTQTDILVHPTGRIRQLVYDTTAGLFYVTDYRVGLVGEHGTWDFLSLDRAQITLRGDSLYICLSDTLGVLALDNISDLAKYAPNGKYTPQARPSLPVEVTDIQFRADPADPNGKMLYGTEFERSSISQVYGIVSLHPKSKQAINAVLTVVWDGPKDLHEDGIMMGGRVVDFFLHFKDGKDQQWRFRPTYMFYPGEYSMRVLLDGVEVKKGHFNVTGNTTLVEAALQDNIPLLKTLLEQGADPDQRDSNGYTALRIAKFNDSTAAVELLLKHGAQVSAKDDASRTERLINNSPDVSATDNDSKSALTSAVFSNDAGLVQVLLARGASPNKPDIDKEGDKDYPLLKVRHDQPNPDQILELLLAHGANPNVESSPGYTALARAIDAVDPHSVRILLERGAFCATDCRVNFKTGSPLRGALSSYLEYTDKDRVKAQKAKDIFFMLLEQGAVLRTVEEPLAADKRLHGWLPHEFVLNVLKRNDQAVLEARDVTDSQLQFLIIARLLEMARAKTAAATSRQDYQAALALCDQAKTRAQVWKIESKCPLIYYNTGLLYAQLRQISAAKDNFKRYLDLVPDSPETEHIRRLLAK